MAELDEAARAKVLDRIRKLMALAGDNPNEHEAAAAAEKAQSMLAEYNLSTSDLVQKKGAGVVFDDEFITESRPWLRPIVGGVAKLYFCECYFTFQYDTTPTRKAGGYVRTDKWTIVGEMQNVIVAKMMMKYLIDTAEKLASEAAKARPVGKSAFITGFKLGCAARLRQRLDKRRYDSMKGPTVVNGGTNLPALANMYQVMEQHNKQAIAEKVGKLKTQKGAKVRDQAGFGAGLAAGDRIGLDTQVGYKDPTRPGHMLPKPVRQIKSQ